MTRVQDRVLPYNLDVERAVLGALMYGNPDVLDRVRLLLKPEFFYATQHRKIFAAICGVADKGMPVDQISVCAEIEIQGGDFQQAAVIAAEALSDIATDAHAEIHAHLIRQDYQRRAIINQTQQLVEKAYDKSVELDDLIAGVSRMNEITATVNPLVHVSVGEAAKVALDHFETVWQNPGQLTGTTSGVEDLDDITDGFQKSDLVIVGARPSMGKTSFSIFTSIAAAQSGVPVAYFSLETSAKRLASRFITALSGVDSYMLRKGDFRMNEYESVQRAESALKTLPVEILDSVSGIDEIVSQSRYLMREKGIGMVVVDYLQLVRGHRDKNTNREQEVAGISWALKMLAKDLDIPVMVLSQLNRALGQRTDKRPQLFDLRESGSLEQDADVVLFLHRPLMYGQRVQELFDGTKIDVRNMAEIIVAKQKEGPTGIVNACVDMASNAWGKWVQEDHIFAGGQL